MNGIGTAPRMISRLLCITVISLGVAGCSSIPRQPAPIDSIQEAQIPGFSNIRYLPFTNPQPARDSLRQAFLTETPDNYQPQPDGSRVYSYLCVSGGGSDGAFGAGILNGWSKAGGRPVFKVVTGVSTGALIAPFAFIGPAYDDQLEKSYTTIDADRIFLAHSLLSLLWSESLTDTRPLKDLVAANIDAKLLDAIAAEHAKGRRLFVATSDLDAEQPVLWDLGAIASSKNPERLGLFRKILVASASIPTVFPPVMIDVQVNGKKYDEMHVDGGVFFQSFFIGSMVNTSTLIKAAHPDFSGKVIQRLYVIRNGRVTPEREPVERGLTSITIRSIGTMLKVSGINDLYRLYLSTTQSNIEFRYIAIPREYKSGTEEQFNKAEMINQYQFGENLALKGIPWLTAPPGYAPN